MNSAWWLTVMQRMARTEMQNIGLYVYSFYGSILVLNMAIDFPHNSVSRKGSILLILFRFRGELNPSHHPQSQDIVRPCFLMTSKMSCIYHSHNFVLYPTRSDENINQSINQSIIHSSIADTAGYAMINLGLHSNLHQDVLWSREFVCSWHARCDLSTRKTS